MLLWPFILLKHTWVAGATKEHFPRGRAEGRIFASRSRLHLRLTFFAILAECFNTFLSWIFHSIECHIKHRWPVRLVLPASSASNSLGYIQQIIFYRVGLSQCLHNDDLSIKTKIYCFKCRIFGEYSHSMDKLTLQWQKTTTQLIVSKLIIE